MSVQSTGNAKRPLKRCKHGKYHKRHRHRPQYDDQENSNKINIQNQSTNSSKSSIRAKRVKRKGRKAWDSTVSNLDDYKLDQVQQVEKKLNRVSKHRHYAKDLVKQQKRKFAEKKREEEEQKQLDLERRQLIQRKHGMLRGLPIKQNNGITRGFAKFTQNKRLNESDASISDNDDDDNDVDLYGSESDTGTDNDLYEPVASGYASDREQTNTMHFEHNNNNNNDDTRNNINNNITIPTITTKDQIDTLQAELTDTSIGDLANQINTLEKQIAQLELKQNNTEDNINQNQSNTSKPTSSLPPHLGISAIDEMSKFLGSTGIDNDNDKNIIIDDNDAKQNQLSPSKPIENVTITKSPDRGRMGRNGDGSNGNNKNNSNLDNIESKESLQSTLTQIRNCLHEMETQRQSYDNFKNNLLELINAQNAQILKLVSSLASHQSQITKLQQRIDHLEKTTIHINPDTTDPTWHSTKEPQITIKTHSTHSTHSNTQTNNNNNNVQMTQSDGIKIIRNDNNNSEKFKPIPIPIESVDNSIKPANVIPVPVSMTPNVNSNVGIKDKSARGNNNIKKTVDIREGSGKNNGNNDDNDIRSDQVKNNEPSVSAMLLDESTDWKSIAALIPSNFKRTQIVDEKEYPNMRVYIPQDKYFPSKGFDHISVGKMHIGNQNINYNNNNNNNNIRKSPKVIRSFLPPKQQIPSENYNNNNINNINEVMPNTTLPRPVPKVVEYNNNNDNDIMGPSMTNSFTVSNSSSLDRLVNGNITVKKFDSGNKSWTMNYNDVPKIRIERMNM